MGILILLYIAFTIGVVIWALADLPRWARDKRKRGKRDDYWKF